MRKNTFAPVAAGVLLIVAGAAQADSRTTTFQVSASVNPNCLVSATPLNFGTYDGTADVDSSSDIEVRCSQGASYTLSLSEGGSGDFATRLLSKGGNTLEYNLYVDDPVAQPSASIWGDDTPGTATVSGFGNGMSNNARITHTVHGLLPNSAANQDAPTGAYTDSITVTIDY